MAAPGLARAQQKFPLKPFRLVVAFTADGATDILARLIVPGQNTAFGQPLVIEPRPGVGGTLTAAIVARASPDGYTWLATPPAFAISAVMNTNLPYDTLKDFSGVREIGASTTVLVVSPSLGVKTVKELVACANARPGKLLYGSTGAFTSTHFSAERFRAAATPEVREKNLRNDIEPFARTAREAGLKSN
jgi:tripartite-type tricarboxylate transporter receptor subunit TctC